MRNSCLFQALALLLAVLALGLGACESTSQKMDEWFGVDRTVVETFDADEVGGRTDQVLIARYAPGSKIVKSPMGDGGVWIEVLEVKNDQPNLNVGLDVRVHNRFDKTLRFDVKDVTLVIDGEEYRAGSNDWYTQPTLETRGMNHRKASFKFPVSTRVLAGAYDVTFKNLRLVDGPDELPTGGDATLSLEVIGKRS